jgi:hypothetical protein
MLLMRIKIRRNQSDSLREPVMKPSPRKARSSSVRDMKSLMV